MDGSVFGAASPPPRYSKAALGASQWRQLLDEWSKRMAGATGAQPRMQVRHGATPEQWAARTRHCTANLFLFAA